MKKRIIIYSVLVCILTSLICFGLFDLILKTRYKNNEITFRVNNDDAFFVASGEYYYGDTSEPTKTYSAQYIQEEYYSGKQVTISPWNIGESKFVNDDDNPNNNVKTLTYVINIKNANSERNLAINLLSVAAHKTPYFYTEISYKNADNDEITKFSNNPDNLVLNDLYYNPVTNPTKVNITEKEVVGSNKSLQITIKLTLNTRTKSFTVDNNFILELESIAK